MNIWEFYTELVENLKNLRYFFCDESDHDFNSACDQKKKSIMEKKLYIWHLTKAYLDYMMVLHRR